jgi:hypothetical protein
LITTKGAAAMVLATSAVLCLSTPALAGASTKGKTHKPKAQPWIGSTITVENENKQYEAVKLLAVTDPAQAATPTITTPKSGDRFVGITISITNKSKGTDTDDANNNLAVVGSNKQVYQPTFSTLTGCTDFNSGQYTLPKGATEDGCLAFTVPTGVSVAKVSWNPNSGFSTNNAYWTAP